MITTYKKTVITKTTTVMQGGESKTVTEVTTTEEGDPAAHGKAVKEIEKVRSIFDRIGDLFTELGKL